MKSSHHRLSKVHKVLLMRRRQQQQQLLLVFLSVCYTSAGFIGLSLFSAVDTVSASSSSATSAGAATNNNQDDDDDDSTCDDPNSRVDNDDEYDDDEYEYDDDACTLYLAESTIPGAGLGVFSAIERHAGERIGSPGGDVCIPVINSWWHNLPKATTTTSSSSSGAGTETQQETPHFHNPFSDYFWQGQAMGMVTEATSGDVEAFCPGLDCVVNCHLGLINVMKSIPENDGGMCINDNKNMNMIHRSTHATAGSFTPYYNGTTIVSRRIPMGGELFKFYGDSWFTSRQETFGYIPLSEDYEDAELILHKFVEVTSAPLLQKQDDNEKDFKKGQKSTKQNKATTKQATTTATTATSHVDMSNITVLQRDLYDLVLSIRDWQETSRILNALPDKLQDALWAAKEQDMSVILQQQHTRPVSWLRQHGRCVDHIQGKISSSSIINNVGGDGIGRGAFARRYIRKGQIITTSPVHHVPHGVVGSSRQHLKHGHYFNHSFVSMYNITLQDQEQQTTTEEEEEEEIGGASSNPVFLRILDSGVRQQLLVNYCYSHRDSTILLCPYSTGVHYINHALPANTGNDSTTKNTANVAVRWAHNFSIAHKHELLLHLTLEQLEQPEYGKPLFAMDYVALRDIEAGEELFLNYGLEWQEAWDAHVQKWNASIESKQQEYRHYHPAAYWNRFFGSGDVDSSVLRTTDEQQVDPYPTNIDLRCHFHLAKGTSKTNYTWPPNEMGFPCQILDRFVENNTIWYTADVEVRSTNLNGVPSIDDDLDTQDAQTISSSSESTTSTGSPRSSSKTRITRVLRTDLPRRAFRFFDKPGTTDIHLPNAFRHWIGLPDEMVPPQWKNLL